MYDYENETSEYEYSEDEEELTSNDYWAEREERSKKRKKKQTLKIVLIVLLALALLISAIIIATKSEKKQDSGQIQTQSQTQVQQTTEQNTVTEPNAKEPFKYFQSQLSGTELADYNTVLSAIESRDSSAETSEDEVKELEKLSVELLADNPELFWFYGISEVETQSGSSTSVVKLQYNCDVEEQKNRNKLIDSKVDELVNSYSTLSDYEKIKSVYEYLILNTVYDDTVTDQSCYSVLVNGRGNCAGYSSAMQLILNRLGIDTIFVSGTGKGVSHAWNMVRLEDKWYHIDVTWGDPVSNDGKQYLSYQYFLVDDKEIKKDHKIDSRFEYPQCNSECDYKISDNLPETMSDEDFYSQQSAVPNSSTGSDSDLIIHFLDVGQADATLITCGGEAMLIDGGNRDDSQFIYSYLKNQGIGELKYIVCTHPHEDHVGGLSAALNCAKVQRVFCTTDTYESKPFSSFVSTLEKQGLEIEIPNVQDKLYLGDAVLTVLGPERGKTYSDNTSIVLRLEKDNFSCMFMGDSEYEDEKAVLGSGYTLKSDVLKIGHHGSNSSTGYQFLYEVDPQVSIISVGKDNSYGHPDENVISRLNDANSQIYRTDENGTIILKSDGKTFSLETEK